MKIYYQWDLAKFRRLKIRKKNPNTLEKNREENETKRSTQTSAPINQMRKKRKKNSKSETFIMTAKLKQEEGQASLKRAKQKGRRAITKRTKELKADNAMPKKGERSLDNYILSSPCRRAESGTRGA